MCGLVGYVGQGDRQILEKMTNCLQYRGPDDEGFFTNKDIGLGHRRLSIIDLTDSANQPISNESGNIKLVFNGEIYNFKKLREELTKKGHRFRSQTDSEVIVHLYEEKGLKFLEELNGMFALAIWDSQKKRLVLARDRYGQKPLYWTLVNKTIIFASELKSVLLHPLAEKKLNHLAIYQYFCFDYVPQPSTVFEGIYKLANGSCLVFENDQIDIKQYYQIDFFSQEIDLKSIKTTFRDLLDESVEKRLVSDVDLGVFLSGGIDSSAIAYFAKRHKNDIKTFSIGFDEKSFDESSYARQVSKLLKTDHYHKQFSSNDLLKIIPEVANQLDEPFGDPSILPTYLLSKFSRQKVKVALGGDGGDELLMGYPNHQIQKIIYSLGLSNLRLKNNWANTLEKIIPVSNKNLTFGYKLKRYSHSLVYPALFRDFLNIGGYINSIDKLFNFETKQTELFNFANDFLKDYSEDTYLNQVNLLFLKYYLQDDILFKVDRASMYNSLEVRAPFLDFKLADFVNSLPLSCKLKGLRTKHLLKEVMVGKLPDNIINRPKKGFGIPLTGWLKNQLKEYMLDSLNRGNIEKLGLINYQSVKKIVNDHLANKRDNRKIIWNLIMWQSWVKNNL